MISALTLFALLLAPGSASPSVPRRAPEFVIRLTNTQHLLLSSYRGKVVVIEFLHTTCPACQDCCRVVNRVYNDLGPKGFQPLGVAFNDSAPGLVPDFISQVRLTFPVGSAQREHVIDFLQGRPSFVPVLVFIDRQGMIRGQYDGTTEFFRDKEANIRTLVERLLKEPRPGRRVRGSD